MTIENMLELYPIIPQEVKRLNAELNEFLQTIDINRCTLKANTIDGMPRGTETTDPTYNAVEYITTKMDSYAKKILDTIEEYISIKEGLDKALLILSRDERKVVELRYFDCIRWDWIPAKMHYSRAHCFNIHNRAIKILKTKLKQNRGLN